MEAAQPLAGHAAGCVAGRVLMGRQDDIDGLIGRTSQMNGYCLAVVRAWRSMSR